MSQAQDLNLRLAPQIATAVEAFRREQLATSSQSEAVGAILTDWLSSHGYFRTADGTRPQDLTAENDC